MRNFKYFFKPYFEQIVKEFHRVSKSLSSTIFEEFTKLEERDLQYRDGAFGITEILQCPIKARLRREVEDEIEVTSNEITDGFIFEHLTKLVLTKLLGKDKVIPEKTLPLDYKIDDETVCKIDGHLDIFIDLRDEYNTVIGLELKSTVLQFDNKLFDKPPEILFLEPDDIYRININDKYILQTKIQRFILERLYPDQYIETYLFIKTQLKTRLKIGKTYIVLPITESISEEHFKAICKHFLFDIRPRFPYECKYCIYKDRGFCEGIEVDKIHPLFKIDKTKKARELLEDYINLKQQLEHLEEQLKYLLWDTNIEIDGNKYGWIEEYELDINTIARELIKKNKDLSKYLQLQKDKIGFLSRVINLKKIPKKKKKKFRLP